MTDLCVPFNIGCEERQEKPCRKGQSSLWDQKWKVFGSSESTDFSKKRSNKFKENELKKTEYILFFQENSKDHGKRLSRKRMIYEVKVMEDIKQQQHLMDNETWVLK